MRFHRHDLIFHLRPTSKISPENIFRIPPAGRIYRIPPAVRNYFPNPAGRPKLFSESRRPSEIIFPNPAGRFFFSESRRPENVLPKMFVRKMCVRKFRFGRFDNSFDSIDNVSLGDCGPPWLCNEGFNESSLFISTPQRRYPFAWFLQLAVRN